MTIIIFRSIEEIHPLRLEMKEKVFSIFFPRHDQKSKEPYFQFRAPRQQQPSSNDFRRLSMRHSTMIEAQPGTLIILFFFVSSFWQMMLLECYRRSTYTRTWIKEERGRVEVPWEVSHRYRVELEGIFLSPQIFSWPAVLSRKTEIHFSGSRMLFFFQANLFSWSHTYLFIILFTFFRGSGNEILLRLEKLRRHVLPPNDHLDHLWTGRKPHPSQGALFRRRSFSSDYPVEQNRNLPTSR